MASTGQVEAPKFDIFEYQVEGNSTLDQVSIEKAVYPFLGPAKTIEDVDAARAALELAYRKKGYATVAVDIPPQKVANGVVVLHVGEGKVGHLHVLNAKYFSQEHIIATVESLQEGKVPYFPKVQEEIAQANSQSSDLKVTPLLRPGEVPGTTDVDLEVEDQLPVHGSLELNNHYAPNTTSPRLIGTLDYDNLFQSYHRFSLMAETSPVDTSQVRIWSAAYTVPLSGQFLALSIVDSDSNTAAGVAGADIIGKGKIIGLHDIIPLTTPQVAGTVASQSISVGLDYKDFAQNVAVDGGAAIPSPAKYIPFSVAYTGLKSTGEEQWAWGGGLEFAARDFDSLDSEFDNKRYKALTNFAILKLNLSRTEPLPDGFSAYGHVDIQLSDQPLISNEQMVVGGADSVRGYLDASAAGDSGAHGSFELRSPNVLGSQDAWFSDLRLHVFVDGAYVRIFSPLPEQTATFSLVSTGVGLKAQAGPDIGFDLELGIPTRTVPYTHAWRPRLQASSTVQF